MRVILVLLALSGCMVEVVEPRGPSCREAIEHQYEWWCWYDGYTQEEFIASCERFGAAIDPRDWCTVEADRTLRECLASEAIEWDCHACDWALADLARCR